MNVERVIVRILADTSSYVRHMALAEYGLHRFGQNVQRINQRTAQAVAQVEEKFATTITDITKRRDTAIIKANSKYHDQIKKITSQRDKELIAAQEKKIQTEQAVNDRHNRAIQSYQNKMLAADKHFAERKIDINNAATKKLAVLDDRMRREKIALQLEREKQGLEAKNRINKKYNDLELELRKVVERKFSTPKELQNRKQKLEEIENKYKNALQSAREKAGVGTPEFDRSLFSKLMLQAQNEKLKQTQQLNQVKDNFLSKQLDKLSKTKEKELSNEENKIYSKFIKSLDAVNDKYSTAMNAVISRRDQLLQRAEDRWKTANTKYSNALNLSNQQRADALKKAEDVYLARVAEITSKFSKSENLITKARDEAINNAQKQWEQSKAKAEQLRRSRLATIKNAQAEALREATERQNALADAHYLTAKTRVIQGAVVAGAAVGAVTLGLTSYATRLAAEYERTALAFEVMMKSAEKGLTMLHNIEKLAVETPFHSQELAVFAKELMAFGVDDFNIIASLRSLGDVAAGTGGRMDRLVLAFGQVMTAGRLMGQEVRQFTNAGVPILEYLSKVMEKPVHQVRQLIHRGDVSSGMVISAFKLMTEEGGRFAGMMDRINKETVSGRWENLYENLQIYARNFALAAFEGLDLAKVIGSITESLGKIDKDAVRKVFEGIRGTFIWLSDTYNKVSTSIDNVINKLKEWVRTNENAKNTIIGIAGIIITFLLITRIIAALVTMTKMLVVTFNVLAFAIKLVTGWKIAYTAVMKLLTIATYAQAIAATKAWLAALGPVGLVIIGLTAAIVSLIIVMKSLGYYEDFGKSFGKGFETFLKLVPTIMKALKDAFSVGDMEGVFDVLWITLKIGMKTFIVSLYHEIAVFFRDAFFFLMDGIIRIVHYAISIIQYAFFGVIQGTLESLSIPVPDLIKEQFKLARADLYEGKINERVNNWMNTVKNDMFNASDDRFERDRKKNMEWITNDVMKLKDEADRLHLNAALEYKTARNIADLQRTLEKMTPQELNTRGAAAVAAMENPITYQKQFQALQQMSDEFGVPNFNAQERYRDLWQNTAQATAQLRTLQKLGISSGAEWDALVKKANQATKELDDFSNVLEKLVKTPFSSLIEKWEYPPKIVDYIDELRESLQKGIHPVEEFSKHVDYLNKSYNRFLIYGEAGKEVFEELPSFVQRLLMDEHGKPFIGINPGAASALIDDNVLKKGLFLEYEKMRKAIGEPREALAPAQLYGSREAQETINKAQKNQMDDTTRIITTIQRGNYLLDKSVQYQQQTSEILKKLADNGVVILKVEDLPGNEAK